MIAFTREPSASRASTIGDDSSTRRPIAETIRSMMLIKCASSRNCTDVVFENTVSLHVNMPVGVYQNIGDRRIVQKRFERPKPKNFVENFLGQPLPLLQIHGSRFAHHERFENLGTLRAVLPRAGPRSADPDSTFELADGESPSSPHRNQFARKLE